MTPAQWSPSATLWAALLLMAGVVVVSWAALYTLCKYLTQSTVIYRWASNFSCRCHSLAQIINSGMPRLLTSTHHLLRRISLPVSTVHLKAECILDDAKLCLDSVGTSYTLLSA
jgi:hypothetical protein